MAEGGAPANQEGSGIGYPRGFNTGYQKGVRVASNLAKKVGYYEGFCDVSLQILGNLDCKDQKSAVQLSKLKKTLQDMGPLDPSNGNLTVEISRIEKIANQVLLQKHKTKADTDDSLSF